ncbi:hypothetical protein E2562_018186 [Oryza meyeriana var. granulata]|uniref:Uncharacterized protein n=1 Tax=Oryza meyeriana var. granulata TaxID=110450 RepID=A0A6G1C7Q6_9ORYZ|nr:hypothetical protein E2562_018186 [Oryza meyeriana var. granulata]
MTSWAYGAGVASPRQLVKTFGKDKEPIASKFFKQVPSMIKAGRVTMIGKDAELAGKRKMKEMKRHEGSKECERQN